MIRLGSYIIPLYLINVSCAMEYINLSYDFIGKYLLYSNPEYIQVYLYIKYKYESEGSIPSVDTISAELGIAPNRVSFDLGFWVSKGELIKTDSGSYAFPGEKAAPPKPKKPSRRTASARPSYKSSEIDSAAEKNQVLSGMFYQAESILGHLLSGNEMELLYSFYDWLGLPCEVIVMLLSYAAGRGKTGKRYLETVAMDWADKGIDTFEKAEDYIKQLEAAEENEHRICEILGIYGRALTQTEKKYISAWAEAGFDPQLIALAYDRTVTNTGKLSCSYMNKILTSWDDEGVRTVDDVSQNAKKRGINKPTVRKSKFNNYEDTNTTDYDALEEKLLDMMLDNS